MLYLADRTALLEWHRPITGDTFWSLGHGPIVGRIYDLIRGKIMGPEREIWGKIFKPVIEQEDKLSLRETVKPNIKPLSRREMAALEKAYKTIMPLSSEALSDLVHKLPEWTNPGEASLLIDPKTIFFCEKYSEEDIKSIEQELDMAQAAKLDLQSFIE